MLPFIMWCLSEVFTVAISLLCAYVATGTIGFGTNAYISIATGWQDWPKFYFNYHRGVELLLKWAVGGVFVIWHLFRCARRLWRLVWALTEEHTRTR